MFKKKKVQKENHMSYFFGGTAIGMAAGLLAGKLFSSTSTEQIQNSESEVLVNKNINKYSQDDNIHNPYFHKNKHHHHRSKSASRYEDKNYTEQPLFAVSLNKSDNILKNDINNLDLNNKCDKNIHKVFFENKHYTLHNITMEDNAKCNISADILLENSKEKKENNTCFEFENIEQEILCTVQSEEDVTIKNENLFVAINGKSMNNFNERKTLEHTKMCETIKLTDTFNSLSINFCEDISTDKNFQNINCSMISSNMFPNYTDNISNIATYNDTTFHEDEQKDNISVEEFCESDIISSTKHHNLEDN